MPQPTPGDVHVNRPLTNISIAFLQSMDEFVAARVFPNVPSAKQSNRYTVYPKGQWFRTDAKKRGLSQESAGTGYEIDNTPTFFCDPYAIHKDIDDQLRANADEPINLDSEATELVTRQMALRREKDWAAKYFATSVWTGSSTGGDITPSTLWDAGGSTPISDMRTEIASMKKKTGFRPNKLILAEDVWVKLQDNADFLDRIAVTQRKIVSTDLLAAVLNTTNGDNFEVLIAGAVENTALEGATPVMDWINSKGALLVHAAPRPSILKPSAGYTFSWTGLIGAGKDGLRVKRFRMEPITSDRVEAEMAYDQKLVADELGVFFDGVIS